MRAKSLLLFGLLAGVAFAQQASKPAVQRFALLHLFAEDGSVAEIQVSGNRDAPVFLFRDPKGNRLRVERTGPDFPGRTLRYSLVSAGDRVSVESWTNPAFAAQDLPVPRLVRINGYVIASVGDETKVVQSFSKSANTEFKKLPSSFQTGLLNFYRYCSQFPPTSLEAASTLLVIMEDFNGTRPKSLRVEPLEEKNEAAIAAFQSDFSH